MRTASGYGHREWIPPRISTTWGLPRIPEPTRQQSRTTSMISEPICNVIPAPKARSPTIPREQSISSTPLLTTRYLTGLPPRGRYDYLHLSDHVGSAEIRRFIERTQPYLVLSGHCHESVVIGDYKDNLGKTRCVNPGSQTHLNVLSLVQFDLYHPQEMKQFFIHAR